MDRLRLPGPDLVTAIGMAVLYVFIHLSAEHEPLRQGRNLDVFGVTLLVTAGLLFVARGRRPVGYFVATMAVTGTYLSFGYPPGPVLLAPVIALYVLFGAVPRRWWAPVGGLGAVGAALVPLGWGDPSPGDVAGIVGLWSVNVALAVLWVGPVRRHLTSITARAEHAERERDREARRRAEERLQIAGDVHDVVAHSLAAISLQAGVTGHLLRKEGNPAGDELTEIRRRSKSALNELRGILGLLHESDDRPPEPRSGRGDLMELIDTMRAAGLTIEDSVRLPLDGLADTVALTSYRIVQEALTNVARHAGTGARTRLRVDRAADAIEIEVISAGKALPDSAGSGRGIAGMRDRARALGGAFDAGPEDGGRGFSGVGDAADDPGLIRVVVADDEALVRAGLRALLSAEPDLTVAGEATDGPHALELARLTRPDVVLMDIRMPGRDGLTITRQIVGDPGLESVRVVILTTFEPDEYVFEAVRIGASGFLLKDADPEELLRGVRAAAGGGALLAPSVAGRLMSAFAELSPEAGTPRAQERPSGLTVRERQVVGLVGQGLKNEEIAAKLVISTATAHTTCPGRWSSSRHGIGRSWCRSPTAWAWRIRACLEVGVYVRARSHGSALRPRKEVRGRSVTDDPEDARRPD